MQSVKGMTPFLCFSAEPGDKFQGDQKWDGLFVAEISFTNQLAGIEVERFLVTSLTVQES